MAKRTIDVDEGVWIPERVIDDLLYTNKEALEQDNNIEINDDVYEQILDDVMSVECDFEYLPMFDPVRLAYEKVRETVADLAKAIIEHEVECMVNDGDIERRQ